MKKIMFAFLMVLLVSHLARSQEPDTIVRDQKIFASLVTQGYGTIQALVNGKVCDSCDTDANLAFTEELNYAIIGPTEFVPRKDTPETLNGLILKSVSRHAIISSDLLIDFIQSADKKIPYQELEFQIVFNNKITQDWKSVIGLPQEKDYRINSIENGKWEKNIPAFQAVRSRLNTGDQLLVLIRRKGSAKELRAISVERIKIVPDIEAMRQFPAGTSTQDILNRILKRGDGRLIRMDELEVEPGNSVLISFDLGLHNYRTVEYAYTDDPDNWKEIENLPYISTQLPSFLLIEKPEPGKTISIMLRYKEQRESIKHIKIIVKPKLTQTVAFTITASLVLAFLLFISIYYFIRRKNKRQVKQLLSKKKDLENKLQLLSGQFNPHFLFNSLNSIQNLVNKADIEEANAYISQVAGFLRTVMNAGKKEFISLKEELEIMQGYVLLEQRKSEFKYFVLNRCEADLSQVDFPPLLLQPILENSIHHGFTKEMSDATITIDISCRNKELKVVIRDNGQGFDTALMKKGHGIDLVEKRIALMNENPGNHIRMNISTTANEGTITTFTFNNWI